MNIIYGLVAGWGKPFGLVWNMENGPQRRCQQDHRGADSAFPRLPPALGMLTH